MAFRRSVDQISRRSAFTDRRVSVEEEMRGSPGMARLAKELQKRS
jgi:hypothetical protein